MNYIHSLAHSKWNCKYHIVFAAKYPRKTMFSAKGREIGTILRELCKWKGVNIIEGEVCPDHVHILVSVPPKMSVSVFMGYLKGKGLAVIEAFGQPFDTDLHEAVAQFPVEDDEKKGKVFDVVQTGYTLNGKVIRFAKVVVGI